MAAIDGQERQRVVIREADLGWRSATVGLSLLTLRITVARTSASVATSTRAL